MSSEVDSKPSWRSRPQDEFVWAFFDADFVAFHRPSGMTHFLNAASHAMLTEILVEPKDLDYILGVFAADAAASNDETYTHHMRSLLNRLDSLGLIECL